MSLHLHFPVDMMACLLSASILIAKEAVPSGLVFMSTQDNSRANGRHVYRLQIVSHYSQMSWYLIRLSRRGRWSSGLTGLKDFGKGLGCLNLVSVSCHM